MAKLCPEPDRENQGADMTEARKKWIRGQARFKGIFEKRDSGFSARIPLTTPVIYKECKEYINQALESGLDGAQTRKFEEELAEYIGMNYALAVNSGEAALRLALRLAAERLYGSSAGIYTPVGLGSGGVLLRKKVFCSDLTTSDMVNPIVFEGGEPVFIDSSDEDWSMDPEVLELAFEKYNDVGIVVMNHVYGFPGQIERIRQVCHEHDALLIECAGEALGASCLVQIPGQGVEESMPGESETEEGIQDNEAWKKAGAFGDYAVFDFGRDKIIGTNGGALLTQGFYEAEKARYWATGAGASTPWNQHEELGYRCTIGEPDAAILRGQLGHVEEIIARKKAIYERYVERLDGEMAYVIPATEETRPNYWITAMTCESSIQFMETRNDRNYTYQDIHGTAAPMEIYDALEAFGVESRPVYKPMSMQPVFRNNEHFTLDGPWRMYESFRHDTFWQRSDVARQYYESGVCLPSSVEMTQEMQDRVIDIVCACYDMREFGGVAWA